MATKFSPQPSGKNIGEADPQTVATNIRPFSVVEKIEKIFKVLDH